MILLSYLIPFNPTIWSIVQCHDPQLCNIYKLPSSAKLPLQLLAELALISINLTPPPTHFPQSFPKISLHITLVSQELWCWDHYYVVIVIHVHQLLLVTVYNYVTEHIRVIYITLQSGHPVTTNTEQRHENLTLGTG